MNALRKVRKPVSYPRLIAAGLDKVPPGELLDLVLDEADRKTDERVATVHECTKRTAEAQDSLRKKP